MIINIHTIYSLYTEKINIKIDKLQDSIDSAESRLKVIKEFINKNDFFINAYLNINTKDIETFNGLKETKKVKYPTVPVYHQGKKANFSAIKLYIDSYATFNHIIISAKEQIKYLIKSKIPFKIFKYIICEGNDLLLSKVIEEGYELNINAHFGSLKVSKNSSNKKRPNWQESNKNRAEIEKRGGIPYKKEDAFNNPNYKGEQWLVYHPQEDLFIDWIRSYKTRKHNPIIGDFAFKPARGKSGKAIVNKLSKFKQNKEEVKRIYNIEL